jgi:uncharacterized protein YxeA
MKRIIISILLCLLVLMSMALPACYVETKGQREHYLEKAAKYELVAQSATEEANKHWGKYAETGEQREKDLAEKYEDLAEQYQLLAGRNKELANTD